LRWLRNVLGIENLTRKVDALSVELGQARASLERIEALAPGIIDALRPGIDALAEKVDALSGQAARAQTSLEQIEALEHGGRAAYVGGGRVLTKAAFPDWSLSYFAEGNDRLISPHLITHGRHEDDLTNFFLRNIAEDSHCFDLGANIGYFACLMAKKAWRGRTIAVEADQKICQFVQDNLHINFLEGVSESICGAISDRMGELTLHRRITRSGNTSIIEVGNTFAEAHGEPPTEAFVVPCFTIDSLLPKVRGRVDFIKIDVEGAEFLAFKGAREAIASNPHIQIVVEWSPAQTRAAGFEIEPFLRLLREYGLSPSMFNPDGTPYPISYDLLAGAEYISGVLLTRDL